MKLIKSISATTKLNACSLVFLLISMFYSQNTFCQYFSTNAPCTVNGVNCTQTSATGLLTTFGNAYTSCGIYTTPANARWLGWNGVSTGAFSVTYGFASPVNNVQVMFTATGNASNEVFNFSTNGGTTLVSSVTSCFSSTSTNQLSSGAGASNLGGGGVFRITASGNFTSLTISGPGGNSGSLFGLMSTPIPLPVELSDFEVSLSENKDNVELYWTSQSEDNNAAYIVEKSDDMDVWTEAGRVDGHGTSNQANTYRFTDIAPFSEVSYYRLSQIDTDGQTQVLGIRSVNIGIQIDLPFPNPATTILHVAGDHMDLNEYSLFDMYGNRVDIPIDISKELVTFDIESLAHGIYILQVNSGGNMINNYRIVVE